MDVPENGLTDENAGENAFLKSIDWLMMPLNSSSPDHMINHTINMFQGLPINLDYYYYPAEVNSESCEKILWYIFSQPVTVSLKQLRTYQARYDSNARGTQKPAGRIIYRTAGGSAQTVPKGLGLYGGTYGKGGLPGHGLWVPENQVVYADMIVALGKKRL